MAPIIFIWIGQKIPSWYHKSINFAARNNIDRKIIFAVTHNHKCLEFDNILEKNVEVIYLALNKVININRDKLFGNNDFWLNTSLRFWYLNYLVNELEICEFFHAELDNAIFSLGDLDIKLCKFGYGLFVPKDSKTRGIASLIFCNRAKSIEELISLYNGMNPPMHDMHALGLYANKYPNNFFALPTESFQFNSQEWRLINPNLLGGIFDAASIGQYFLGIDPISLRFKLSWNCFINENCKINWNQINVSSDGERIFINFRDNFVEYKLPLFNLHIHSKNWKSFQNLLENGAIMTKLQKGKRSIISGKRYILLGGIFRFILLVGVLIKKSFRYLLIFIGKMS